MTGLLLAGWLFTLPGMILSARGVGRPRGIASVPGPALLALVALAVWLGGEGPAEFHVPGWLPFLPESSFALRVDPLATVMLVVVGAVSTAVYVYSLGYMQDDPGQQRYFALLDLFVSAMSLLVLAGNLAVLLIGWAGVGLASFLLISFYREPTVQSEDRPSRTLGAGLQALAANAVGDAALLLAVVLVPTGCGDLLTLASSACVSGPGGAGLMALLLLIAASAKSAQGPLYFWLPSAMAGPTPVSALIHAATMVAAGVYLMARVSPLLALSAPVLSLTMVVGVATALLGGLLSLRQSNFKRGLAYSTVSQLGFMFAAVGFGAPFAAFFHLFTHASFKALLFLSAGAVIHATHGEEQLSRLGGLRRALPWAYGGFLLGALALIGLPGTAGAFSKDAILEAGLHANALAGWLLVGATLLSGLYIGRLLFGVFHGPEPPKAQELHQSPVMNWPLVPLAVGAVLLGYVEWPAAQLSHHLEPVLGHAEGVSLMSPVGAVAFLLGLAGFVAAGWWRFRGPRKPAAEPAPEPIGVGWVEPLAAATGAASRRLAAVASGQLGRYLLVSLLGIAVIVWIGLKG